ncbi:TonB-dependent receptor [Taibaiella sp. KBW10]|uniref:TonB-dependent receptor n=1 Tax=Taibaiella sp. KBW10 TaxID=2153357 RepID=UPI000F5B843D|nr:TonB-dependent receptor [Taibaiella sp. KBW10]RQO30480.1 TonB-dependent receptor [Taibaiella sp. KBW10]
MPHILAKHIKYLALLLGMGLYYNAAGQKPKCNHTLAVLVKDAASGESLIGADVQTDNLHIQTDVAGLAPLQNVCPESRIHIHVTLERYKAIDETILIGQTDTITLSMQPLSKDLSEVQVIGHHTEVKSANAQASIAGAALEQVKGNNIAAMASKLSGVTMLQTGASIAKPVINGMTGNRILILNNGVRQEGQQWGAEHAPEIDGMTADNITVVKGAESVRYGRDAIGGVLLINPPALPYHFSGIHGTVNLMGMSNGRKGVGGLMLNGALGKQKNWAWRVQSSLAESGNYRTPEYFLDNTGTRERNYSAALGYNQKKWNVEGYYSHYNNEIGIFKGSHIGDTTDLKARIANGRPFDNGSFYYGIDAPRQVVQHDLGKLKAHYHLNEQWNLDAQYSLQHDRRQEYDIRRGGRTSIPSIDLKLLYQELNIEAAYTEGKHWKGNIGINGSTTVNNNEPDLYTVPLIPNYDAQNLGLFALARYLGKDYTIEGGLRYDYQRLNAAGYDAANHAYGGRKSYENLSATLGINYSPNNRWRLMSNAGTAWRPPTVNELYSTGLHHGAAQYELGDSTLRAEKSVKWMNTIAFTNYKRNLSVELNAYVNYFDNYIYLNPSLTYFQSLRGAFPVFNYKSTNALFTGLDLMANYALNTHWDYNIKGSIIRAKDISNDRFLPFIPSDRLSHSIKYSTAIAKNVKSGYISLEHVMVAKQTRYEAGSDYAPPPQGYQLLNLGAGLDWTLGKQSININLGVNNLTNQLYKEYMNRFRYYAHDLGRSVELRIAYKF